MLGFQSLSSKACQLADLHEFDQAISFARASIKLYPANFLLISELISRFSSSKEGSKRIQELDSLLIYSLTLLGEDSSVYHYSSTISFLRSRILRSLININRTECSTQTVQRVVNPSISRSKRIRIGILSCIWKRPKLTDIFLLHLSNLSRDVADTIELVPIIIGSEPESDILLCDKYPVHYLFHPNNPLSEKWQYGLQASKKFDLDALLILGSDDFIDSNLLSGYCSLLSVGVNFAGLSKAYFFDINTDPSKMIFWNGYGSSAKCLGQPQRLGETIGMARIFSRQFLEDFNYSFWPNANLNKGLDYYAMKQIVKRGHLPISLDDYQQNCHLFDSIPFGQVNVSLSDFDAFAADIKFGHENITSFSGYISCSSTHHVIKDPWNLLSQKLGPEIADRLYQLSRYS